MAAGCRVVITIRCLRGHGSLSTVGSGRGRSGHRLVRDCPWGVRFGPRPGDRTFDLGQPSSWGLPAPGGLSRRVPGGSRPSFQRSTVCAGHASAGRFGARLGGHIPPLQGRQSWWISWPCHILRRLSGASNSSPTACRAASSAPPHARPGCGSRHPSRRASGAASFPARSVATGKTIFRVDEFLADDFVVTDQAPGSQSKGEMSYADLAPPPPEPPAPPEAQPLTIPAEYGRWLRSWRT
jgi:hypothetical protein